MTGFIVTENFSDFILKEAYDWKASDVHIVPKKGCASVSYRVDHDIIFSKTISLAVCESLISHFKFLSSLDISEKRFPQNGSYNILNNGKNVSLRISTLPSNDLESLVIRILPQQSSHEIKQLSLFPQAMNQLVSFLSLSHGMILLTGPTGSGKTTTLYSLLQFSKKNFNRNIITLEDPIEKTYDDLLQVQVNEKAGITYSTGLKAILRHDPDVIMVGEIRDSETARIAIRAALTGHLVLTSLHTKDTIGAIHRLREFGITNQELEQTLLGIVAQRLVKTKCPFCSGVCSTFCLKSRKLRRIGVFEILHGQVLSRVIQNKRISKHEFPRLKQQIKKGIALGFLNEDSLKEWGES